MKKLFIVAVVVSFLGSCGDAKTENQSDISVEDQELTADMSFARLIELDQQLVNNDLTTNEEKANELLKAAKEFAEKFPEDTKTADAVELSAKAAEALGKYNDAVNILHDLIFNYDETDKTPSYMYNKARVLEERMGKKENAKKAYQELIDRFPNDPLGISAKEYMEMNFMDMSEEELIQFLESQNKEA